MSSGLSDHWSLSGTPSAQSVSSGAAPPLPLSMSHQLNNPGIPGALAGTPGLGGHGGGTGQGNHGNGNDGPYMAGAGGGTGMGKLLIPQNAGASPASASQHSPFLSPAAAAAAAAAAAHHGGLSPAQAQAHAHAQAQAAQAQAQAQAQAAAAQAAAVAHHHQAALAAQLQAGGPPPTALSSEEEKIYQLIAQLCVRPDPSSPSLASGGTNGDAAGGAGAGGPGGGGSGGNSGVTGGAASREQILQQAAQQRETALLELSKKREQYEDLALVLWHSFGVMSSLLQEIISVYPLLSPPSLTAHASNRVCNALALLQCVASHNETRGLFLNAHIPLFLYPFLNTTSKTRPFEYLRLTSLGVIGALVKQNDNSDVITFLLSTEIIPLCLRIMETGSELSKTVAIFIVQKILLDDMGLAYICQTYERFYAVGTVLSNMVNQIVESQAVRLLKHVVRCYLRLSDNPRAREALRACLPGPLRDATFSSLLKNDHITKRCLATLLLNLSDRVES